MTHPQAELIRQFYEEFIEDAHAYKNWEWHDHKLGEWERCHCNPEFKPTQLFRRKPKTIRIVCEFDIPAPMRVAPENGTRYWVPKLHTGSVMTALWTWNGDSVDSESLESGICHLTREAAEFHCKALLALTKKPT